MLNNDCNNFLKETLNSSPFITYIPLQISQTLNEQLKNINTIEIIGCEGFNNKI